MSHFNIPKFNLEQIGDGSVSGIVGRRGSGKTSILDNILYVKRRIPDGIGCSGSEESNGNLSKRIPPSFVFPDYNREAIGLAYKRARQQNSIRKKAGLPKKFTFIILDDVAYDKNFTNDPLIKEIFFNGRHNGVFFIFTQQYALCVKPDLRAQIDYVFLCREPIQKNRKKLWESYAGVIPTFKEFEDIMDRVCRDYRCLVIAQNQVSGNIEDSVFWFKADTNLPDFKMGSQVYWRKHYERFNPHYDEEENEYGEPQVGPVHFEAGSRRKNTKQKYTTTVKLLE
jgi:hypothetical protein